MFFSCKKYQQNMNTTLIPEWAKQLEGRLILDFKHTKFGEIAYIDGLTIKKEWCN